MTLWIILGVIVVGLIGLWLLNRQTWRNGPPSLARSMQLPTNAEPWVQRGGDLPQGDREVIEQHCTQCGFRKPLTDTAQSFGRLMEFLLRDAKNDQIQAMELSVLRTAQKTKVQPCPQCGSPLQFVMHRYIIHRTPTGTVEFETLRQHNQILIVIDDKTYPSLAEIADPELRRTIAEALNLTEDTDDDRSRTE